MNRWPYTMKTRKRKIMKGGKVLASGGFGCVFRPSLKCSARKKETRKKGAVSKLMLKDNAKAEFEEIQRIKGLLSRSVPNYSNYFLLDDINLCEPQILSKSDLKEYTNKCRALQKKNITVKNINQSLDRLLSLNMPDGGISVSSYWKKYPTSIDSLNQQMHKLLTNGILPMNTSGIFHGDVKDSNVLVMKQEGQRKKDSKSIGLFCRLIDWGLSTTYTNGTYKVPKIIQNRPLQYNLPYTLILFNSRFYKEYDLFRSKEESEIQSLQDVKDFVVRFMEIWGRERGEGHTGLIGRHLSLLYTGKEGKKKESSSFFAKDIVINYISAVLVHYRSSKDLLRYFNDVFIKNVDRWGFLMVYLKLYSFLAQTQQQTGTVKISAKKIPNILIEFLFSKPNEVIDVETAVKRLSASQLV